MRTFEIAIAKTPVLGRVLLTLFRIKIACGHLRRPVANSFKWLFTSQEITNLTYDLEDNNKRHLASLIADIANVEFSVVMAYIEEIEGDAELRGHIADKTMRSDLSFMADKEARFGRRAGWYALVRILKPNVVVETGVDKGLGACVLAAALKRNKEEGHEGRYYGTDINPKAGYLLSGDYIDFGTVLYGDSIESLKQIDEIDLFVNDSDHSEDYEAREYEAITNKLSPHAVVLGDNSHLTDALLEFSLKNDRHFIFFQERPLNHIHPGCGIGISFKRENTTGEERRGS